MKLLAVDTGTQSVGWAVFDGGGLVDSGSVQAKGKNRENRLGFLYEAFRSLFTIHRPETVVYEAGVQVKGNSRKTYFAMGMGAGVLVAASKAVDGPAPVPVVVTAWKLAFCGKGCASKEDVSRAVADVFGVAPEVQDEADAIGIGAGWLAMEGGA